MHSVLSTVYSLAKYITIRHLFKHGSNVIIGAKSQFNKERSSFNNFSEVHQASKVVKNEAKWQAGCRYPSQVTVLGLPIQYDVNTGFNKLKHSKII